MNTVLILGSNSDVGQACAYRFAAEGFDLQLASRRLDEDQESLASDLNIRFDCQTKLMLFDALTTSSDDFLNGLDSLPSVVILCIGLLNEEDPLETNSENVKTLLESNFTGLVPIINALAQRMIERKSGTIIGVSSVAGERGRASNFLYGSAKAGLTAYLSGLQQYCYNKNVQVITIKPGFIRTKMIGDLPTPGFLTATSDQVAKAIFNAYQKQKNTVYVLGVWLYIMLIIRNIPTFIFKRLRL